MKRPSLLQIEHTLAAALYGLLPHEYDKWQGCGSKMAVQDAARSVSALFAKGGTARFRDKRYAANPSINGAGWFVWDMEAGIDENGTPKRIIFTGTMEECGGMVDSLEEEGKPRCQDCGRIIKYIDVRVLSFGGNEMRLCPEHFEARRDAALREEGEARARQAIYGKDKADG